MSQFQNLKISRIIRETSKSVSIYFDVPSSLKEQFKFHAGQYLTLKANINGEEVRRAYSISSAEDSSDLRVSVKKVEGGKMSTHLVDVIKEGDVLEVMPPEGRFTLVDSNKFVFVAGGSGITPILSLIKKAISRNATIHLLYANKSQIETMFKQELDGLLEKDSLKIDYYYSDKDNRLTYDRLKSFFEGQNNTSANVYICGPQGLIESAESVAKDFLNSDQIHVEYFASPEKAEEDSISVSSNLENGEVQLIIDGDAHTVKLEDHETILEAGERLGIDPPFSCQSGVCTTCRAKVLAGEVDMENNFGLGQDEIEEGYILTCISKPKGDGLVVSWDED